MQIAHPLTEYINGAFGGDTIGRLVSLADTRDELVKAAPAGLFTDPVTGSVDVSMAVVIAMPGFNVFLTSALHLKCGLHRADAIPSLCRFVG